MSANAPSAAEPDGALTEPEFARLIERLGPFESRPRLAVAVSGGPDSLALTLLADRWARARAGSVVGVTVDHRLRAESTAEARLVGSWLQARGIGHAVLAWSAAKPHSGLQAAARDARYRLLATFCRTEQILHLLLGHHRDDQAETVALRRARGSGPTGLAGMAAIVERRGFRLVRPVLDVPKDRLTLTLRRFDQNWLDDPWNRSPVFARGRLRAAARPHGPDRAAASRRVATDRMIAGWLARHARAHPLGFVDFDLEAFRRAEPDLATDVLKRVLLTVGGNRYAPGTEALERLRRSIARGACGSLAGVLVRPGRTALRFVREAGAIRGGPLPLTREMVFDHRFRMACEAPCSRLTVDALGERGWLQRRRLDQVGPPVRVERAVGESLPVLLRDGSAVAIPQLGLAAPAASAAGRVTVRWQPRHALAGPPHGVPER